MANTKKTTTTNELPVATLASILGVDDTGEEYIDVPQWGQRVKVKGINKSDQMAIRKRATVKGNLDDSKLEMLFLVHGLVEPSITPVEADKLLSKSMGAVDTILGAIFEKSGMQVGIDKEADADFPDES